MIKVNSDKFLEKYIPNFEYHVIDLSNISKETIREKKDTLSSVFLLETSRIEDDIKGILDEVSDILDNEEDDEIYKAIIRWIFMNLKSKDYSLDNIKVDFDKIDRMEGKQMILSLGEKIRAKGIAIGEAKGIAKEKKNIAKKMLSVNESIEKIVLITGLSKEEILKLKDSDN